MTEGQNKMARELGNVKRHHFLLQVASWKIFIFYTAMPGGETLNKQVTVNKFITKVLRDFFLEL